MISSLPRDRTELRDWLIALPRGSKRTALALVDFALLALALWLAMSLRLNELYVPVTRGDLAVLLAAPAITVATFFQFGLYRLVTRYISSKGTTRLISCIALAVMLWGLLILGSGAHWVPRSVVLALYPFFAVALTYSSRRIAALALKSAGVRLPERGSDLRSVAVYGANATGVQLVDALLRSNEARVVGFLDETPSLWGQYASGVKIYKPDKLARLIEREGVEEVILAIPESRRRERSAILKLLQQFPISVKTLPSIEDFAAGRATVSELRPVDVEDLLGRDPVPPDPALLANSIRGKPVMVTGAGGSIGSELVRQILRQGPSRLVLFELSEAALYEIDREAQEIVRSLPADAPRPAVVATLGSVLDEPLVRKAIRANDVTTIFHAAAYKHVPIVEQNPVAGLANNTFGTEAVAKIAREEEIERFVLISTDKAVRPTNVMGASKRLAELVLQAHAADPECRTVFTMVRFGNVLDSSGSVVRLFRKQIQAGGPVTVTDRRVVRFFMSIPEAAGLVLQAGAMARGGEVFLLDMGEAVKIDELARSMIRLMGLEVKDDANPDGDIAITYVGLREGEKLYEEVLIQDSQMRTQHPRIFCSDEPSRTKAELERELAALRSAMVESNLPAIQAVLLRTVEGYTSDPGTPPDLTVPDGTRSGPRVTH